MATIVTRTSKGSALTHTEADANLTNINAELGEKAVKANNLSDLPDAGAARTNLGLGTAAVTASTDYATAAQGALADSAIQPNDNISTLTNNSNFISDITGENLTDLADVTITSATTGQVIKYNGSAWINDTDAGAGIASVSEDTGPELGGNLNTAGFSIKNTTGTSGGKVVIDDNVNIIGAISNDTYSQVNFADDIVFQAGLGTKFSDADGSHYVKLVSGDTVAASWTLKLPVADGTSGQALVTDASGQLSFATISGGSGIALTDLSVTQNAAGTAALSYNNTTGVFSYTPPNLSSYLTSYTETNDLSAAVTWANVPDANITQSSVTQHQAALTITESQISDLSHTTALAFSAITSKPTTLSGYGITDGYTNADVDSHLNQTGPTTGYVLSWNGSDYAWVAQSGGGGGDVVDDTSPQLGGNLDVNGQSIVSVSDGDITIVPNGTGSIVTGNLFKYTPDDSDAYDGVTYNHTSDASYTEPWTNRQFGNTRWLHSWESTSGTEAQRHYGSGFLDQWTLSTSTSSSNARYRQLTNNLSVYYHADVTPSSSNHGIQGYSINHDFNNTSGSDHTVSWVTNYGSGNFWGTLTNKVTVTNMVGFQNKLDMNNSNLQFDRSIGFYNTRGGSASNPNEHYGYLNDFAGSKEGFGNIEMYREELLETTHSSSGAITLDYNSGNTQKFTLGAAVTAFNMSNWPTETNELGSMTVLLKQDGTGSRSVSFTAGGAETFLFAGGNKVAAQAANAVTIISIVNYGGGEYYWHVSGEYSA